MATIAQILAVKWPNAKWSMAEDDYSTLRWESRNIPKPSEAEIRAFSDEITGDLQKGKKAKDREEKVLKRAGDLLEAIEVIATTLGRVANSITPAVLTEPVDLKDLRALIKRLDDSKEPNPGDGNSNANDSSSGAGNSGGNSGNAGGNPNKP